MTKLKFRFMGNPKCIVNSNSQTLVHLEELNHNDAVMQATDAIDHYYYHTLRNLLHQSKSFSTSLY